MRHDAYPRATDPLRGGRTAIPVADVMLATVSVLTALFLAVVAAFVFVTDVREWLGSRGGLVHWTAAALLVVALCVALWAYSRSSEESRFRLIIPTTAGLLTLQVFRFGADVVGTPLPSVSGREIGSLIDLRDVVAETATTLSLGPQTGLLVLILLIIAAGWAGLRAWIWARTRTRVTETIVVAYFVTAVAAHLAVPLMGFFGQSSLAWFLTNLLALVGASMLIVAGIASGDHRSTAAGWRRRMWAWLGEEQVLRGAPSGGRML